jgi:hypothetical protein
MAQCDEQTGNKSASDSNNAQAMRKNYTGRIGIADIPPDEVWMSLIAERLLSAFCDVAKGRRMCCVSKSMENRNAFTSRNVEFARGSFSNIGGDNLSNFLAEWLNGDYENLLA